MLFLDKIVLKKKIKNVVDTYIKNNDKPYDLYFQLYKFIISKQLNKYFYKNSIIKRKNVECVVCFTNKKFIYKTNCCNNPIICLDCFSQIFNNNCKCIYCRNDLMKTIKNDINLIIYKKIYNKSYIRHNIQMRKIYLLNKINKNKKFISSIYELLKFNENLLNSNNFDLSNIVTLRLIDFDKVLIISFNDDKLHYNYIWNKNKIIYFEVERDLFIKLQEN